jgi:hypothetical protein
MGGNQITVLKNTPDCLQVSKWNGCDAVPPTRLTYSDDGGSELSFHKYRPSTPWSPVGINEGFHINKKTGVVSGGWAQG